MCRLLALYGKIDEWREIVMAFSRQAETGNVPPVLPKGAGHKDGWGMAIANSRQTAMVALIRQMGSAYGSACFREAVHALPEQPGILLCHLRQASENIPVTPSNTHPFVHNGWGLIHNGTVYQARNLPRDPDLVFTSQDSDTEHLFHYLLTKIKPDPAGKTLSQTIADAVGSIGLDYTALNLMLSNGRELYVIRNFKVHADYYTLYCCRLKDGVIICSQPIEPDGFASQQWTLMDNRSLIKIHGSPPRIDENRIDENLNF
jgi:predicted glutamine amidotransferase